MKYISTLILILLIVKSYSQPIEHLFYGIKNNNLEYFRIINDENAVALLKRKKLYLFNSNHIIIDSAILKENIFQELSIIDNNKFIITFINGSVTYKIENNKLVLEKKLVYNNSVVEQQNSNKENTEIIFTPQNQSQLGATYIQNHIFYFENDKNRYNFYLKDLKTNNIIKLEENVNLNYKKRYADRSRYFEINYFHNSIYFNIPEKNFCCKYSIYNKTLCRIKFPEIDKQKHYAFFLMHDYSMDKSYFVCYHKKGADIYKFNELENTAKLVFSSEYKPISIINEKIHIEAFFDKSKSHFLIPMSQYNNKKNIKLKEINIK